MVVAPARIKPQDVAPSFTESSGVQTRTTQHTDASAARLLRNERGRIFEMNIKNNSLCDLMHLQTVQLPQHKNMLAFFFPGCFFHSFLENMQMCTRYGCQIVACSLEQYLEINTGQVTFVFRWECGTINKHEGVKAAYSKNMSFSLFVLSVCGLMHHIVIVAHTPLPAAAPTECKHPRVLRLMADLPVTRLLNPSISGGQASTSTPNPLCVLRGPDPGSVINFAQAVKHTAAVQLAQRLPPPLPPPLPRHPRGPTPLKEVLLMSTTSLASRIKTRRPGSDPPLPLTAARFSA